jgi:hypothetical protein
MSKLGSNRGTGRSGGRHGFPAERGRKRLNYSIFHGAHGRRLPQQPPEGSDPAVLDAAGDDQGKV